jgi:hypothetical protein
VISRYKVQCREAGEDCFYEIGDWAPTEQCIATVRSLFAFDSQRDFQITDESGTVVASTVDHTIEALMPDLKV